ncbi:Hypothetical predicted protein [Pelobates cultripes]|uniref:Uncharacterized protein n=1 Tax=Pelobates cultripes TaxID=61616 RepID=A0AAD1WXC0_PELCU|nr:Hypothetical predicted protein [Pelobates cultripes]
MNDAITGDEIDRAYYKTYREELSPRLFNDFMEGGNPESDDVLLMITEPKDSMDALQEVLAQFGVFSGYSANLEKSSALLLGLSAEDMAALRANYNIPIAKDHKKYLGIQLPNDPAKLYHLNYAPLM